jgi:hypothetical protein
VTVTAATTAPLHICTLVSTVHNTSAGQYTPLMLQYTSRCTLYACTLTHSHESCQQLRLPQPLLIHAIKRCLQDATHCTGCTAQAASHSHEVCQ